MTKRKIEQWLTGAKAETIEVPVCLNRELLTEFDRVMREYEQKEGARKRRTAQFGESGGTLDEVDPADDAAQRLVELNEKIEADKAEHVFCFRKMPYDEYTAILEKHPPTEEQRKQNQWLDHNPVTAAPYLVAGSCVDPQMTLEDAQNLQGFLPETPWASLYDGAIRANRTGVVIPKSVSSTVAQLGSELKSTTAANGGSRSASSADA